MLYPIEILAFALNILFAACCLANAGKVRIRMLGMRFDRELAMGLFFLALTPLMLLFARRFNPNARLFPRFVRLCYIQLLYIAYFSECIWLSQLWYGGRSLDAFFAGLDRLLFGFQPAIEFSRHLQAYPLVNELFFFSYFFYYALVTTGVWVLFFKRRFEEAERALFTISSAFFIMYAWFVFFPVKGPKYHFPELYEIWYRNFRGYLFTDFMKGVFNRMNLAGAAFPSSHVAVALVSLLLNWKYNRHLTPVFLPLTLLLFASTIYLYAHYFVDIPAGLLAGLGLYFLVPRLRPWACRAAERVGSFLARRLGFPPLASGEVARLAKSRRSG